MFGFGWTKKKETYEGITMDCDGIILFSNIL